MEKNKVVITGADGFVGSEVVRLYLEKGHEVLAIDLPGYPNRLIPDQKLSYISLNLFDNLAELKQILTNFGPSSFIHFAWAGSSGPQRADYSLQLKNAETTVKCLEIAKESGCNKFVCAGSIMEYEVEAVVHANGSKPGTGYIYGMGKHIAHSLCKAVAANEDIDLLWPMITNAYGVGELSPRFINTTLRKIINNEPLEFTAGTQNYDFVYITDVAKAFYLIEQEGHPFTEYMIGSGQAGPLKNFIKEMVKSCAPNMEPHFGDIPFTGINLPIKDFSIELIEKDCGFKPEIPFSEGILKTYHWLKTIENAK